MSVDNVCPEANPLFAFTMMIVGAFAAGGCDYLGLLLNLRSAPPYALGDAIAMATRRENSWFKVR